jgi:hypothetical protein
LEALFSQDFAGIYVTSPDKETLYMNIPNSTRPGRELEYNNLRAEILKRMEFRQQLMATAYLHGDSDQCGNQTGKVIDLGRIQNC